MAMNHRAGAQEQQRFEEGMVIRWKMGAE